MAEFDLGVYGIKVTVDGDRGGISSDLHEPGESPEVRAAMDALESLILGHAFAGMEITSPAYLQGIESAVATVSSNADDAAPDVIRKVTSGFVVQVFNADTGDCMGQEFVSSDEVEYEDARGNPIDHTAAESICQPFHMVQPPNN